MRKIHPAQLLQTSETQSITYKVNSELIRWEKNEFEKEKDLQRERERDSNLRILMSFNLVVRGKTLPISAVSFR